MNDQLGPLVLQWLLCNLDMCFQRITDELLHIQRFGVSELASNAYHKEPSMTAITAAPGKGKTGREAPLGMITARNRPSDCCFSSARPAIQPKYTALPITINPLVHLLVNILSGPR